MGNNWFTTYVIIWVVALWLAGVSTFLLKRISSTSKYWLSLSIDRFTLNVKLTPPQVRRRLAATINPFTRESSAPYTEQWVTTDAFDIDRFANSRLLYTHGEIWSHPEGALISVTLRTPGLILALLALFVLNPLSISSPIFLAIALGFGLLMGSGYYYLCLAETRRVKTFLTDLLNLPVTDEAPLTGPSVRYQEPILYTDQPELEQAKDRLVLTYAWRSGGFILLLVIALIWAGVMLAIIFSFIADVLAYGGDLWILLMISLALFCASLVLLYYALAGCLNRTIVTLTRPTLSVRHQPLPFFGHITLPTAAHHAV
jgi:hypothetical protein